MERPPTIPGRKIYCQRLEHEAHADAETKLLEAVSGDIHKVFDKLRTGG